jgi:tetratricopeptide (TPR) repeat protein
MCDAERRMSRFDPAIRYCQRSINYDPADPYAHFALALAYTRKAVQTGSCETLPAALKHFRKVVDLNAELDEARMARQNIANIEKAPCH